MNYILEARNLHKTFKHPQKVELLVDLSFAIKAGESVAITGRSGEGKTTLLHILGGLEPFDQGELLIHGEPIKAKDAPRLRNLHFGFIFQSFNLLEDLTALENVLLPARIARTPLPPSHGLKLLAEVGLEERAHFPAKLLSGGEKQRVAIARALCNNPDILFADEPSGNLDIANADAISNLLFHLVATQKKALVLVTHDPALAARCQRTLELSSGKLR
jgi:lipoprotein-releasing system ATP-binding protein